MVWREYHEATKHSVESLHRSPHYLDWASMPDPFRHYEGVPVLDLPADPPAVDGATFLSRLLFHSAAISATKVVPTTGYKYALRVNPSSGNLHPTEFHFATRGLQCWPDGLYHYRASSHMAEQRALGDFVSGLTDNACPIVFVLSSIAWREAWKYRERAYRYCLHDMGHAWQSLALSAHHLDCETFARAHFADDAIAQHCRLNEDEWPMLLIECSGTTIPVRIPEPAQQIWYGGAANILSEDEITYRLIEKIHTATKLAEPPRAIGTPEPGSGAIHLPAPLATTRPFEEIVRGRRSALDFRGGSESMTLAQLSTILNATAQPYSADFATTRFVQLYLYAHRVNDLEPGVYRHWPERNELELIKSGDQRVVAAGLSLGQNLAGNACVAFSMLADLERATTCVR